MFSFLGWRSVILGGVPSAKSSPHRQLDRHLSSQLAQVLKRSREAAALTQEQVAASSQVSVQLIRRLEAGTSNPTLGTLQAVAAALNLSVAEVLAETEI